MKRTSVAALAAAFSLTLTATAFAAQRVTVPGGTNVPIRMVDTISSGTANVGDTFEFKADDNVVVNGWVVIARGAEGRGEITKVDHAGGNGHPGSLGLQLDYVYAVDGEKIRLSSDSKSNVGEQKKGGSSTATLVGYALMGPVGLFAHNWVKGREITIDSSKTYSAFVDSTVHVVSNQRGTANTTGGFAH
ncbi:MAG TPA: hypothetical protein VFN49_04380 [Candidatus Aquilonibacter sp.]|nr:hypothetical protein [Candidatus Aquilonibacter sp.]